jgi:DNA polymerase-3 subunit gamma/tau
MRGATAPRLILELICGRILLPIGDASESGLLARIERLERVENIAPQPRAEAPAAKAAVDPADYVSPATAEAKRTPSTTKPKEAGSRSGDATPVTSNDAKDAGGAEAVSEARGSASQTSERTTFDVAGLRRLWPDVIENVKKRRRLTWSLLSASAQILGVDDKIITIGIVNAGARDSFVRSESDEILRQAFIEVVGLDRKIECTVDPSIDTTSTPEARAVRTSEAPNDPTQLSGAALLAAELGATVISETSHD